MSVCRLRLQDFGVGFSLRRSFQTFFSYRQRENEIAGQRVVEKTGVREEAERE